MRGCVRSCSRRQRRPQHHLEPSAGPAFACPAAAAAGAAPAAVPPKRHLHGQVNLCGRLLLLFLLLFQRLLLPLPSRSRKPLTQLTLAQPQTVPSAQLSLAPRAPLRRRTHHRLVCDFLQSCIAPRRLAPAASLPPACPAALQPPPGAACQCPCRAAQRPPVRPRPARAAPRRPC